MEQVKIFVKDSFHTSRIVKNLQAYFGDVVQCSTALRSGEKYNLFFLSGKEILYEEVSPGLLKEVYGAPGAKVVAVSTLDEFLREIADEPSFCVDFTIHKNVLVEGLVFADKQVPGTPEEKLSHILQSVQ